MSTVTQPKIFNHEESQRKVRHPLYLVRASIRRYIILEGLALTLLFASILFWAGLAVDFGLYKFDVDPIFGLDWILALNDVDPSGGAASLGIRVVLLGLTVVGLAYLGFTRVVTRWFREFNDQALALVLERRPRPRTTLPQGTRRPPHHRRRTRRPEARDEIRLLPGDGRENHR